MISIPRLGAAVVLALLAATSSTLASPSPSASISAVASSTAFHPSHYPKSTATCKATRRAPAPATVVDIKLRYVNVNPKAPQTIIMVHGWPSVWSTWARQIQEFQGDYHLVVPNLRGFGDSTHPGDVRSSGTLGDMVNDLVCILEHAGVRSAICMGHDWGAEVCYEAGRARPDIFTGVVGGVVPFIPSAGPFVPTVELTAAFPKLTYQIYFDNKTDAATKELNTDVQRTLRATLRTVASPPPDAFLTSNSSFLKAWDGIKVPAIPFFTPEEETYMVHEMGIQGFGKTFEFYTTENRFQSWEVANTSGNTSVLLPVLAVYPNQDPVANWAVAAEILGSASFLPKLTTEILDGAHWVHLENPTMFNQVVRNWLKAQFGAGGGK